MDSLTQIVLGAAVGEAALGKKVGNKALLYGAIAGTIPDLDVVARYFTDTVSALEIHRGITHSFVFSIVIGLLLGWLVSLYEKRANWKEWSWLFFLCLVTHPLLDAHTTWGTQFFWPLDLRLAYKNIFVIDPLYTLPFLVCVIIVLFQKKGSSRRRRINNFGLILSSSYMLLTLVLKGISYQKFVDALQDQNIEYTAIETKPSPFNTILWTANVDTKDAYLIGDYSFFDSQPISFSKHPKNHELLGNLRDEDKVERLIKITNGWYSASKKEGNIYFNDLRFGLMSVNQNTEKYAFSYLLIPGQNGLEVLEEPKSPDDAKRLLSDLWQRIWGN